MLFKNIKTGNVLEVTNKDVIGVMTKQPDIYIPIKAKKNEKKPAEGDPKNTEGDPNNTEGDPKNAK